MFALFLDEMTAPRPHARAKLTEILERPFDVDEADEWDRERWGFGADQIAAAQATENLDIPTY